MSLESQEYAVTLLFKKHNPRQMLFFGSNAKYVYETLVRFIEMKDSIEPKLIPKRRTIYEFSRIVNLSEMAQKFILDQNFDKEKMFDAIIDYYNKEDGIDQFIDFRIDLKQEEEKYQFHNLAFILQDLQQKRKKQSK